MEGFLLLQMAQRPTNDGRREPSRSEGSDAPSLRSPQKSKAPRERAQPHPPNQLPQDSQLFCELDSCGGRRVSNLRDHYIQVHFPPGMYHWSCVHLDNVLRVLSCALGVPGGSICGLEERARKGVTKLRSVCSGCPAFPEDV